MASIKVALTCYGSVRGLLGVRNLRRESPKGRLRVLHANRSSGGAGEVDLEVTGGRRCQNDDLCSDLKVTGGQGARGDSSESHRRSGKVSKILFGSDTMIL
ncbi:hypothetical protein Acr_23g0011190 [Actinidia rufa]|uniref:Uncharacterized protein n=1 Tax=Actinidia rufa TaxID=165716 RepID=A0A7J0GQ38_9ERIC|nr:hypothetical protein Acr_23g0011190 [Actinidia rufa]